MIRSSTVSKIDKLEQQQQQGPGQLLSANSSSSDLAGATGLPPHASEVTAAIHSLNEAGIGTWRMASLSQRTGPTVLPTSWWCCNIYCFPIGRSKSV